MKAGKAVGFRRSLSRSRLTAKSSTADATQSDVDTSYDSYDERRALELNDDMICTM